MIYAVVCTDVNDYVDWQCEFLEYSWKRAGQSGELIRLVTCSDNTPLPRHRHARVVRMAAPSERTGGYLAFERLFVLQDWLRLEQPQGTVLILDPDCAFRGRIEKEAQPGAPIAQHWVDHRAKPPLQAATWPALIHTGDLERLLPGWINFTGAIHASVGRWESDMFGFVTAAAVLGMRFSLDTVAAFINWPDEVVGEAPIVHYCQDVVSAGGEVLWSKRAYRPWGDVPGVEEAKHSYCRDLLAILNEYAALRRAGDPA
jgi:hypothetical protein